MSPSKRKGDKRDRNIQAMSLQNKTKHNILKPAFRRLRVDRLLYGSANEPPGNQQPPDSLYQSPAVPEKN